MSFEFIEKFLTRYKTLESRDKKILQTVEEFLKSRLITQKITALKYREGRVYVTAHPVVKHFLHIHGSELRSLLKEKTGIEITELH